MERKGAAVKPPNQRLHSAPEQQARATELCSARPGKCICLCALGVGLRMCVEVSDWHWASVSPHLFLRQSLIEPNACPLPLIGRLASSQSLPGNYLASLSTHYHAWLFCESQGSKFRSSRSHSVGGSVNAMASKVSVCEARRKSLQHDSVACVGSDFESDPGPFIVGIFKYSTT